MSQNRREIRELKRRNLKHDPALRELVIETVKFIENSKSWKKSQEILEKNEIRWYEYTAGTTANKEAYINNCLKYLV